MTFHTRRSLPDWLALAALSLAAIAAASGLLFPDLYRDSEAWVREARATDLVTLLIAVPVLAVGMVLALRHSVTARLVATGALAYLAYSYAIFAFSVAPNPLTLLYIATLGTAAWALVLGIWQVDDRPIPMAGGTRQSRRATGAFLLLVPILFAAMWLGGIMQTIQGGSASEDLARLGLTTNPIWALDLAFALPVVAYGGIRLLRGEARALATALPGLVFLVLIGLAVLGVFALDAAAGTEFALIPSLVIAAITLVAVLLAYRSVGRDGSEVAATHAG
jgi:hypothetical protein